MTKIKFINLKSLFIILFVFLGIFALAGRSEATVFVDTNWDSGTPPAGWPCKNAPNSVCSQTDSFDGWRSPLGFYCADDPYKDSWAVCGRNSTFAHSGTYSYYMFRDTDISDTCDIQHTIAGNPGTLYVRFYLYFPSSMVDYNSPVSEEPFAHFLFTNSALSNTGFRINLLAGVSWTSPWTCGHGVGGIGANTPYMFFNCQNNSTQCTVGAPAGCYNLIGAENLDRWQCVEFGLDAATKKYNVWIDGNKLVDNVTVPMSQNNFTMMQFSGFESQNPSGYQMKYYIDDIVASDTGPIGCGTPPPSDTTPPSISGGSPIGTLAAGTTQTAMSVSTNENAFCRWSATTGTAYSSMTNIFSTTGATSHSTTITGLSNGQTYNRYVRCQDTANNVNTSDYPITFSVASDPAIGELVAAYSFDEGSGSQANDSSGKSNTGTISGATWTSSGKYGKALSFNEVTDRVEVLTNGWTANKGTVELWAKADSFGAYNFLFGHTTIPVIANRIQLYTNDAEGWLDMGLGDTHNRATNIENLNTGQWYYIALTWNGTNYNVFVNGASKANGTYTGLANLASSADIGNDGNPAARNEAFSGTIDEVRIYNKVLSQSEIQTDMNTPIGNIDVTPPAAPSGLQVQ